MVSGIQTEMLRMCLWQLAATRGILVDPEGQDEDEMVGGKWKEVGWWNGVIWDLVDGGYQEPELRRLKNKVLAWAP